MLLTSQNYRGTLPLRRLKGVSLSSDFNRSRQSLLLAEPPTFRDSLHPNPGLPLAERSLKYRIPRTRAMHLTVSARLGSPNNPILSFPRYAREACFPLYGSYALASCQWLFCFTFAYPPSRTFHPFIFNQLQTPLFPSPVASMSCKCLGGCTPSLCYYPCFQHRLSLIPTRSAWTLRSFRVPFFPLRRYRSSPRRASNHPVEHKSLFED